MNSFSWEEAGSGSPGPGATLNLHSVVVAMNSHAAGIDTNADLHGRKAAFQVGSQTIQTQ